MYRTLCVLAVFCPVICHFVVIDGSTEKVLSHQDSIVGVGSLSGQMLLLTMGRGLLSIAPCPSKADSTLNVTSRSVAGHTWHGTG